MAASGRRPAINTLHIGDSVIDILYPSKASMFIVIAKHCECFADLAAHCGIAEHFSRDAHYLAAHGARHIIRQSTVLFRETEKLVARVYLHRRLFQFHFTKHNFAHGKIISTSRYLIRDRPLIT